MIALAMISPLLGDEVIIKTQVSGMGSTERNAMINAKGQMCGYGKGYETQKVTITKVGDKHSAVILFTYKAQVINK